jgi:hypothetical protein
MLDMSSDDLSAYAVGPLIRRKTVPNMWADDCSS